MREYPKWTGFKEQWGIAMFPIFLVFSFFKEDQKAGGEDRIKGM